MTSGEFDADALKEALSSAQISEEKQQQSGLNHKDDLEDGGVLITCFSDVFNDVALHFQILRLPKQIYVWIGCNSAKLGRLYAAAPTRPKDTVSVTSILGGASDNTGSGIARRLVLKTGLNIVMACNIPKNSPMLEAAAEKILIQKLIHLGYTRPKAEGMSL
ncbi:Proteasome assembly chaperone 4 [Morella rubra]|uniref:Proteasome assembly chaperone 4 n=1 Tax=Morella rubra TaxID=262757 RepID=A0A6A1VNG2_9ROSI|nr:Proteasome assembly chaperone 4 [Morella rubra]